LVLKNIGDLEGAEEERSTIKDQKTPKKAKLKENKTLHKRINSFYSVFQECAKCNCLCVTASLFYIFVTIVKS